MTTKKWRIIIDFTYADKETCIREFERIAAYLKEINYRKCWVGNSGSNTYGVNGPSIEQLSDEEINKLRELIK